MADPKVNFIQKQAENTKTRGKPEEVKKRFKVSLPIVVAVFSTIFFMGVGALTVKFMWGIQNQQLERVKAQREARLREFEQKDLEYTMQPLAVNVPDEEGIKQLEIGVTFQVASEFGRKEFAKREPQIRDDLIILLSGTKVEELKDTATRKRFQEEIVSRVNKFLGPRSQVKNVFFPNLLIEEMD